MRLNLFSATTALLAYGITAATLIPSEGADESTGLELAQSYDDGYTHGLSQTYSDIFDTDELSAAQLDKKGKKGGKGKKPKKLSGKKSGKPKKKGKGKGKGKGKKMKKGKGKKKDKGGSSSSSDSSDSDSDSGKDKKGKGKGKKEDKKGGKGKGSLKIPSAKSCMKSKGCEGKKDAKKEAKKEAKPEPKCKKPEP